ncbi:MAG: four helix bundle protein [Candidatus Marinimicrobia bacterium]|nr:four helix bundle protein [Candidatus Neomarinimicrobiota bacterium]
MNTTHRSKSVAPTKPESPADTSRFKPDQTVQIIYEATVAFGTRFLAAQDDLNLKLVNLARSANQSIGALNRARAKDPTAGDKHIAVAQQALADLLQAFHDYLRTHRLPLWDKSHPRARNIRRLAYETNRSYATYRNYIEAAPVFTAVNALVCLIHQGAYLLERQRPQPDEPAAP